MRRILLDNARRHSSAKRGSGGARVSLDDVAEISADVNEDLIVLDMALQELEKFDAQQAKIIELRYFGGLTIEEAAEVLQISSATIKREWTMARAWLYKKIVGE